MDLKDFVKKVITDLTEAVEETKNTSSRNIYLSGNEHNRTIEFDVAVTAEVTSEKEGGAGIRVLEFISIGGSTAKDVKNSTVSRIKFGVTVGGLKDEPQISGSRQAPTFSL